MTTKLSFYRPPTKFVEKYQKISNHSWSPTFVTILVTNVGLQEFNKCCNLYAAVSLTWPKFFFFMCTKEKRQKWHICQEHQTKVHVIFWLFQKWAFCFDACTWDHGCNNKHLHCTEICLGACTCGLGCKYKPFPMGINVFECMHLHPSCKHGMGPQRFMLVERPRPWCEVESSMGLILPENPSGRGLYWV